MNDKLKNLWRYIFPAMGGLFMTYLYNVVDGILAFRSLLFPLLLRRCFLWAEQRWSPSEWAEETRREQTMPL